MGAFQSGFSMGQRGYQQALDNERQAKLDARQEELHRMSVEEGGLRLGALRNEASRQTELAGLRTQIGDAASGFNRQGFNNAANADFDAMVAASEAGVRQENAARQGVPAQQGAAFAPAAALQSNQDYEAGLRARSTQAPDITSDPYQRQMVGLRQQYALTSGDMAGFDNLAAGERKRLTDADDAQFAAAVIKDPAGESAVMARSFINDKSRSLGIDTDPKTGISTFRIIKGDKTKPIEIGPSDMGKIAVGVRRLQRGDVGGLDVISAVNKDLAAVVREEFKLDADIAGKNNEANYKLGSLAYQGKGLDLRSQEVRIARDRANQEALRNRQLDPADVKILNDMSVALQNETDPIKRQKLTQDFRVAQANAMSKIGRAVGLPEGKPGLDVPFDKFIDIYGDQPVKNVNGTVVKLRDLPPEMGRAYYMQFRNGSDSPTGLPDVAPPPRRPAAAASGPPAPPAGNYGLFEAMPDSELARYVRAGNALAVEVARRRRAEPVPVTNETPY